MYYDIILFKVFYDLKWADKVKNNLEFYMSVIIT